VSHEKQFETRPLAGTAPTSDPERSFGAASWAGLCAALAILVLSLAVSLYRLALPSDGWSVGLFVYAGQAQLIFGRNLLGAPSALHAADVLVAIEGQPAETLLARTLQILFDSYDRTFYNQQAVSSLRNPVVNQA
jgi:hypothetical protein